MNNSTYSDQVFLPLVLYVQVTENSHRYLKEIETREEAGTPAIVGSVRAGLAFQLKQVQKCQLDANEGLL